MGEVATRLGLLSLEPWDEVWRRNQHLVHELLSQSLVSEVRFISPPAKLRHVSTARPIQGVIVQTPHLLLPRGMGGRAIVTAEVSWATRSCDVLWVNDARLGVTVLRDDQCAVYDVTDDWRCAQMTDADRLELVRAEDALATRAMTVVCSEVLAQRWLHRYGVQATVVQNGVAPAAHAGARCQRLPGPRPHAVYVGTLHRERLDVPLLISLAALPNIGQIDLVGPDSLDVESRRALLATGRVVIHGPVPHEDVPSIMAAADVLLCPHVVDDFTLSLDAIKSFEYLATTRPIVATPTSGFQLMVGLPGLQVVSAADFPAALRRAVVEPAGDWTGRAKGASWAERARQFAGALENARLRG